MSASAMSLSHSSHNCERCSKLPVKIPSKIQKKKVRIFSDISLYIKIVDHLIIIISRTRITSQFILIVTCRDVTWIHCWKTMLSQPSTAFNEKYTYGLFPFCEFFTQWIRNGQFIPFLLSCLRYTAYYHNF
jgi:hypothetical protein